MAEILPIDPLSPEPERIGRVVERIRAGEVVAIPTDTLYGLAADAMNARAVEKVFELKGRAADVALPLLVDSVEMALRCAAEPEELFGRIVNRFWPGPLTIVVRAVPEIPGMVTAGTGFVGLRFAKAPIAAAIAAGLGGPITATSANRSGQPPAKSAAEVGAAFIGAIGGAIGLVVDGGPSTILTPSTVIRVEGGRWEMLREGAVPEAELLEMEKFQKRS